MLLDWLIRRNAHARVSCDFIKRGEGWLSENLAAAASKIPVLPVHRIVERRAAKTDQKGQQPLWEGYKGVLKYHLNQTDTRRSSQVRTNQQMGQLYSHLCRLRSSDNVLEFGTAFGVSGMYWLSGLKAGHLYTFEPNIIWADIARENIAAISENYTLTVGTFEENCDAVLGDSRIDIAFIDAIHTSEFVDSQFAIVKKFMKPGGLVLFDDTTFSSDMKQCWEKIATASESVSSALLGGRVGIVELL